MQQHWESVARLCSGGLRRRPAAACAGEQRIRHELKLHSTAAQHAQQRGGRNQQRGTSGHGGTCRSAAQRCTSADRRQRNAAPQQPGLQARHPLLAPHPPVGPAAHLADPLPALLVGHPLRLAGLMDKGNAAGAGAGAQQAAARLAAPLGRETDAAAGCFGFCCTGWAWIAQEDWGGRRVDDWPRGAHCSAEGLPRRRWSRRCRCQPGWATSRPAWRLLLLLFRLPSDRRLGAHR